MTCTTCQLTQEIPLCTDALTIGQTDFKSTNVYIFIEHKPSGRIERQDAVTDSDGVVVLDMTLPVDFYTSGPKYELWVTLRDTNTTERLPIWIAGEFFECFELTVSTIFNDVLVNYTSQVLQLDGDFIEVTPLMDFDGARGVVNEFASTRVQQWEDQAGLNNAIQTNTALQPDLVGTQLDFDGGDFMVIPDFTYDLSFIHIMALVENTGCTPTFEQFQDIFVQYEGGNLSGQAFAMYLDCSDNSVAFDVGPDNDAKFLDVNGGLPVDTLVLVEGIFDAGEHMLDLDGIRVQTESFGNSTRTAIPSVSTDFHIGAQPAGPSFEAFLKGGIKGIRIFNSKLDAIQRQREILRFLGKV